jgi:hypothetical protein
MNHGKRKKRNERIRDNVRGVFVRSCGVESDVDNEEAAAAGADRAALLDRPIAGAAGFRGAADEQAGFMDGLAAVRLAMREDGVLGIFLAALGIGQFVFEREVLAVEHGGQLGGLHAVELGHGVGKIAHETLFLDARGEPGGNGCQTCFECKA